LALVLTALAACGDDQPSPNASNVQATPPGDIPMPTPTPRVGDATPEATAVAYSLTPFASVTITGGPEHDATVEDIYAHAEESLRELGGIYHGLITIDSVVGSDSYHGSVERWVDVERDVAREETTRDVTLTVSGGRFFASTDGVLAVPAPECHAASAAIGVVLGCTCPTTFADTTVEHGVANGQPVVILVTIGNRSSGDS
jgi:hypothetical protein